MTTAITRLDCVRLDAEDPLAGFREETLIKRFLPYNTKMRISKNPSLVRAYLRFPPAWLLLGKQSLLVAEKPG